MAKDRILIIEDNDSLILFYKGILASLDIKIDTASSFDEAISKLKEFDYCFHIIDIALHGNEPGTLVIGKCGADPGSCLVLSASMNEELVTELKEVYGVPRELIMTKPVDADHLFNLVKQRLTQLPNEINDDIDNDTPASASNDDKFNSLQAEKLIFKHLFRYVAQYKIRTLIFIIFMGVFLNFFITYMKIDAYNEIYSTIETHEEQKFRHFNKGNSVSGTTFVEISGHSMMRAFTAIVSENPDIVKEDPVYKYIHQRRDLLGSVKIKFYPNDNYLIVVIDDDDMIRHVWIPDKQYMKELGLGKDLTFFEIFIKAWAASFKNF